MKSPVLFLAAALALGSAIPAAAQRGGNQAAGALASFPNGGDGLSAAVENVLKTAPNAQKAAADARQIVELAKTANTDQKAAIAKGIMLALVSLDANNRDASRAVRAAMQGLDAVTRAILAALQTQLYAQNTERNSYGRGDTPFYPGSGGGFAGGGGGSPALVSPH